MFTIYSRYCSSNDIETVVSKHQEKKPISKQLFLIPSHEIMFRTEIHFLNKNVLSTHVKTFRSNSLFESKLILILEREREREMLYIWPALLLS